MRCPPPPSCRQESIIGAGIQGRPTTANPWAFLHSARAFAALHNNNNNHALLHQCPTACLFQCSMQLMSGDGPPTAGAAAAPSPGATSSTPAASRCPRRRVCSRRCCCCSAACKIAISCSIGRKTFAPLECDCPIIAFPPPQRAPITRREMARLIVPMITMISTDKHGAIKR